MLPYRNQSNKKATVPKYYAVMGNSVSNDVLPFYLHDILQLAFREEVNI
jgi:hypothetical protein